MKRWLVSLIVALMIGSAATNNVSLVVKSSNNSSLKTSARIRKSVSRNNEFSIDSIVSMLDLDDQQKELFKENYTNNFKEFTEDPNKLNEALQKIKSNISNKDLEDLEEPNNEPNNDNITSYLKIVDDNAYSFLKNWVYNKDIDAVLSKPDNNWYTVAGDFHSPLVTKTLYSDHHLLKNEIKRKSKWLGDSGTDVQRDFNPNLNYIFWISFGLYLNTRNGRNYLDVKRTYSIQPWHKNIPKDVVEAHKEVEEVEKQGATFFKPSRMFKWVGSYTPTHKDREYLNKYIKIIGGFDNYLKEYKEIRDRADAEDKLLQGIAIWEKVKFGLNVAIASLAAISVTLGIIGIFSFGITVPKASLLATLAGILAIIKEYVVNNFLKMYYDKKVEWETSGKTLVGTISIGIILKGLIKSKITKEVSKIGKFVSAFPIISSIYHLIKSGIELFEYFK